MSTTMDVPVRLEIDKHAPSFMRAMSHLANASTKELDAADIDPKLRELVNLRVSQINGCAYCLDMHSKDARAIGETEQRLHTLAAWRDTPFFDARERAALNLAEKITLVAVDHVPDADFEAAAAEFNEHELAALITAIVMINAWNNVSVATHAWLAGSYEP
jgi:AhpD family alkylhydroperoxidase